MKTKDGNLSGERVQTSFLAEPERKVLLWMAPKIPRFISPDMLTYLGLLGLFISGASYYLTPISNKFLIFSSIGLVINWLGDSLDGTLARVRNQQRPKYGYYLDHLVDAFGVSALIFGLSYSNLISQPMVWLVLVLFFIASINTYLATNSVKIFKISYLRISTTEARVLLIFINTLFIFVKRVHVFGFTAYWLDLVAGMAAAFILVAIIRSASKNLKKLDREERALWEI